MTELHKLEAKVDFFKLRYNLEEKVSILVSLRGLSQTSYLQIPLKFLFLFFLSLQKDLECYAENISILKSKCHSSQCKSSGTSSLWPRKCPKGTNNLRAHDCKYRESLARLKKSKILIICQKNPFRGTIFEKNIFNYQESIVFEKMRKNENSGFLPY